MAGQVNPETSVRRLAVNIATNYTDIVKLEITDQRKLKTLKNLVKNDQTLIEPLIKGIYTSLKSENADNRIGAVLIADAFFERSGKFREALVDDFQDFLTYAAETDPLGFPIPPPHKTGKALKLLSLKTVRKWHEKFGPAYKKLELAYRFLKQNKCLDIERLEAETEAERRRQRIEDEKKKQLRDRLETRIRAEIEELKPEITRCETEMATALQLIYPLFSDQDPTTSLVSQSFGGVSTLAKTAESEDLGAHGIFVGGSELEIEISSFKKPEILQSEDNQALIQALRDNARQIHVSFIPKVNKWLNSLTKIGGSEALTKSLIDSKQRLLNFKNKFNDLKLVESNEDEMVVGSDEEDLEEVPEKEGLELGVPENPELLQDHIKEYSLRAKKTHPEDQPSTSKACFESAPVQDEEDQPSSSIRQVSFGLDLKYWGRESEMELPSIVKNNCDSHRFWRPPRDEEETEATNSEAIAYRTRVMTFVGSYKPDTRECRAPLPNKGGICKRQHKNKCPLHGTIIDRNEEGEPVNRSDHVATQPSTSKKAQQTHWRPDPELMRDVEAGTGKSLVLQGKRKKGKKKNHSVQITPRKRLEQKLFDKKALRRVGDTLDAIQKARAVRKHAHQFNYV